MATKIFDYPLATSVRRWLDRFPAAKGIGAGDDLAYTPDMILQPQMIWHSVSAFTATLDWYLDDLGPNVMVPATLTATMTIRLMAVRSATTGAPAVPGNTIARFRRPGGGWNFPLNITGHDGAFLCTLWRNGEAEFRWNGTAWTIAAYDNENAGEVYPGDGDYTLDPKSGVVFYRWGALTADRRVTVAQAGFNNSPRIIYVRHAGPDNFRLIINGVEGFTTADSLWLNANEMAALRWRDDLKYMVLFVAPDDPVSLRSLGGTGNGGTDGNATSIQGRAVATTAPADGQLLKWSASQNLYVPANDLQATGTTGTVPTLQTYGGNGNDSADNAGAFNAAGSSGLQLLPGVYRVSSSITLNANMIVMKGAFIKPMGAARVTIGANCTIQAGDYQWIDTSGGGSFGELSRIPGLLKAGWAPGGDLGAKLNMLRGAGGRRIEIPTRQDGWTISQTVVMTREMYICGNYQGNNTDTFDLIFVQTGANKAGFELLATEATAMYNVAFENLSFFARNDASAPSCLFWCGARVNQHAYFLRWFRVVAHGHYRLAILYDVSCEECMVRDCNWRVFSFPGTTNCPRRGVCVHTGPHLATELTVSGGQPLPQERSHSAWSYDGGDYWVWNSTTPNSGVFVLLNNCWDMTFEPDYIVNGNGGSNGGNLLIDSIGSSNSNTYGIRIGMKGRTEGNSPLIHIDWNLSWSLRGISILYGTHFAPNSVVRGETGQEKLNGFYVDGSLFLHDDGTILLFENILQVQGSSVTFRRKPVRWSLGGGDRYPNGLPGNGSTDSGVLDSSFDVALRNAGGTRINGRCLAGA
jgi:hypothetical protein